MKTQSGMLAKERRTRKLCGRHAHKLRLHSRRPAAAQAPGSELKAAHWYRGGLWLSRSYPCVVCQAESPDGVICLRFYFFTLFHLRRSSYTTVCAVPNNLRSAGCWLAERSDRRDCFWYRGYRTLAGDAAVHEMRKMCNMERWWFITDMMIAL